MIASATGKAKRRPSKIGSKPDCDGKSPWLDHLRDVNQGAPYRKYAFVFS